MFFLILLWITVVLAAIYLYCRQAFSVFKASGVKHHPPLPLLGNMMRIIFKIDHSSEDMEKLYFLFPEERFVGKFEFMNPLVCIRDLELVKKVAVKDFEHFLNHRSFISDQIDPLVERNLFMLRGEEWKDMRSTLSPAFTSSKIRLMVPFMMEVGDQMIKSLKIKMAESRVNYIDVDIRDLTNRYATDVIASCAFGLKVDSHMDIDNQFYVMGKKASTFKYSQFFTILGYIAFPKLMKALNITITNNSTRMFFTNLVNRTMQNREDQHIIRPDMIHLLMEAKKGKLRHDENTTKDADAGFATVEESSVGKKAINRVWSDDDLVAQAVFFFIAGFEPVSSTMSFLLHELAMNPEVQARLVEEIRENDVKNGGKFDYNSVQSMVYLDMVVSEVLRLWPVLISIDRTCTKDYNLGKPNSKSTKDFIISKGSLINIPIWGLHRDPQYYPDPLKFDPERFSEKNKHKIHPFAYMPFGSGPRNCIGSRFSLCEVKVMVYQLLQNMEVSPCEKTCVPSRLDKTCVQNKLEGGHWLRIKPRV